MIAYEELVERCATAYDNILWGVFEGSPGAREMQLAASRAFLAEVLRTLETVTPEMLLERPAWTGDVYGDQARDTFVAMLRASPLSPPA